MTNGSGSIPLDVQRTVIALLTSDTADLRQLARIAGRDPATFYRGAHLRKCDLSTIALNGIDLTGVNDSQAKMPRMRVSEADRRLGSSSIGKQADIAAVIEEFKPHIAAEEAERLELAFITDLLSRRDKKDLELAVARFLALINQSKSAASPEYRSVWAKLVFNTETISDVDYFKIIAEVMKSEVLRKLDVRNVLAVSYLDFLLDLNPLRKSSEWLRRNSIKSKSLRESARESLLDVSRYTKHSEVILEIATTISKFDRHERNVWRRAIQEAPDLLSGRTVIARMANMRIAPDADDWNALMRKSSLHPERAIILREMIQLGAVPNPSTHRLALALTPDFSTGMSTLVDLVHHSKFEIDPTPVARVIESVSDAIAMVRVLGSHAPLDQSYLSVLFMNLASKVGSQSLLDFAFSFLREYGVRPDPENFGPAIRKYFEGNKINDAIKVALLYPDLPESMEIFRSPHGFERAEHLFRAEFQSSKRPYVAAMALAFLNFASGRSEAARHWIDIALAHKNSLGPRATLLLNLSDKLSESI